MKEPMRHLIDLPEASPQLALLEQRLTARLIQHDKRFHRATELEPAHWKVYVADRYRRIALHVLLEMTDHQGSSSAVS